MLLNLSNHPSAGWGAAQRQATLDQFGGVEDLPFPEIPPEWDAEEVVRLAEAYAVRCRTLLEDRAEETNAVHVMGEMTFTCAVVARLQARGVRCVASTTERLSEPQPDGSRRVEFRFVRFREYPHLSLLNHDISDN